jgi:hypothetical protein
VSEAPYLVPDRECGECTACCTELAITLDGMRKLPGVTCEHCVAGGGCAIYAARPAVCRDYHCLWRSIPQLPDSWRPDRSGFLFDFEPLGVGFPGKFGVKAILIGGPETLQSDEVVGVLAGFVENGTTLFLNIPGRPGMTGAQSLVNDAMLPPIRARDLAATKAALWGIYEELAAVPAVPVELGA